MNRHPAGAALFAASLLVTACASSSQPPQAMEGQRFGLMTSLPIYRAPQASVADALRSGAGQDETKHWLRAELEADNTLAPIDLLDRASLAQTDILLLIQPHALTPTEYVALDEWVRGGGQVFLVADPMMSGEPRFALGDPRNPQAIALTGAIHARWGLQLVADKSGRGPQGHGPHAHGKDGGGAEQAVPAGPYGVPVLLGGTFERRPAAGGDPVDCDLRYEGLVAVCAIGAGQAVLMADATIFESETDSGEAAGIFWSLMGMVGDAPAE